MAKEVIERVRCDVCGTTEGVREFKITLEGQTKAVDLCEGCGAPVVEVFKLGTETKAGPRKGRSAHAVVPIEDWDPTLLEGQPGSAEGAEEKEDLEDEEDATEAELLEAAQPLIGTTQLSDKVVFALSDLARAVGSGRKVKEARAAVMALNPRRIKIPDTDHGRRLRTALIAYQETHGAAN